MKPLLRPATFLFMALAVACSGNVVVDQPSGGTGGDGGSITTGQGGALTTTTTSVSSSSSTTSTTGGPVFGCQAPQDEAMIGSVWPVLVKCGMQFVGNDPPQKECIEMATGLSDACATCCSDYVDCVIQNCLNPCLDEPFGPGCLECRTQACDPSFFACSGTMVPPDQP